ncbi:MAG: hypothetical protein EXS25_07900 [Pedosphaera sp.]|nr:hypothetical protein [Pedosphaera sp.]
MKQNGSISRFAVLFSVLALLTNSSTFAAESGKAEITSLKGGVTIDGQAAFVGDAVALGQVVVTSPDAELNLFLGDNGPTLVVFGRSTLAFSELNTDKTGAEPIISTQFELKSGKVAGYVKKTSAQSKYLVKTSKGTASFRGSQTYEIDLNGKVSIWEGKAVMTLISGASFEVAAGQTFDPSIGVVVANTQRIPANVRTTIDFTKKTPTETVNAIIPTPTRPDPLPSDTKGLPKAG